MRPARPPMKLGFWSQDMTDSDSHIKGIRLHSADHVESKQERRLVMLQSTWTN